MKLFIILLICSITVFESIAQCRGSAHCTVCTNCSRCRYCKAGGSCGACGGGSSYSRPRSKKKSYQNSEYSSTDNSGNKSDTRTVGYNEDGTQTKAENTDSYSSALSTYSTASTKTDRGSIGGFWKFMIFLILVLVIWNTVKKK